MRQTWRWFGPRDKVTLPDIRQAGAEGIVTSLYHVPPGEIWTPEDIEDRKRDVMRQPDGVASGLLWDVVESLPVSEAIKTGGPDRNRHIANWIESLRNLATADVRVICYNFMPVLDWTRTDLAAPMPSGATALRFDFRAFAAFDICILKRPGADTDYPADIVSAAEAYAAGLSQGERDRLVANVLAGLPGTIVEWDMASLGQGLAAYNGVGTAELFDNLQVFLRAVVPVAEELGVRLCCHPDDPPWPLLGLPRIVSTEADYRALVDAAPSPANGITFCTGSLGARADNDLPGMVKRLGAHVHFLHLRNVRRETTGHPGSFFEDEHLEGSTDMIAVLDAILDEEAERRSQGRSDWNIPMRPDHGQEILTDAERRAAPGYPAIGRLKGLAELRGAIRALEHDR